MRKQNRSVVASAWLVFLTVIEKDEVIKPR